MSLDITKSAEIIEIMENYISMNRPPLEIRNQLDISYEIVDQSVIINEVRPLWSNPSKIMVNGYAKTTFVHSKNIWKVYWKRADNKWHEYEPFPTVNSLKSFLLLVDEDKHGCFKG